VGIRDRLRKLEHNAEGEAMLAVCLECGAEERIRQGILLELTALKYEWLQGLAQLLRMRFPGRS
jgi:hypothetical protein